MEYLLETIGWLAALLILLAYILISAGKVEGRSVTYQMLNILGAAGFVVYGVWKKALPSAALNVVWMGIGIFTLMRARQPRPKSFET